MKKVLNNYSSKNDINIRQIVAYKDNVLEIEEYKEEFTHDDTMNVMSVTKSITSLLICIVNTFLSSKINSLNIVIFSPVYSMTNLAIKISTLSTFISKFSMFFISPCPMFII